MFGAASIVPWKNEHGEETVSSTGASANPLRFTIFRLLRRRKPSVPAPTEPLVIRDIAPRPESMPGSSGEHDTSDAPGSVDVQLPRRSGSPPTPGDQP
jgi:hypothetical protein